MHILVVNDDGPPSQKSSPYIHAFIETLQSRGHVVSVVLPHQQRSWIGKAHFVGELIKPTYFRPGSIHQDDGKTFDRPSSSNMGEDEWVLVNSTPATCAQLGLFHFFQDRGPVDVVVSGPNYGRNSTALFSLSSGTVGGAMEAALFRKKAIALSFAFDSRHHKPDLIAGGCRQAVKIVEYLYQNWAPEADLYNINIPLVAGVEDRKILYTYSLQNYWSPTASLFEEVEATDGDLSPEIEEMAIRQSGELGGKDSLAKTVHKHKHFKFAPRFSDVTESVENSSGGNDGWAIMQGFTSVTPLKTNFMHVPSTQLGELKLSQSSSTGFMPHHEAVFHALINYEDLYVQPLILGALESHLPPISYTLISSMGSLPMLNSPVLQITSYETIDFTHLLKHPSTSVANAYIIRKALIRKHYLAHTISAWSSKTSTSTLKEHVKLTLDFELDYAEFLDEALIEAYELRESFVRNEALPPAEREWWILKPGMSDRGQGIRLFSTESELKTIFEGWEESELVSDDEPVLELAMAKGETHASAMGTSTDAVITSQLRHFVVQQYIHPPLLLPSHQNCKFHLRCYALAIGALRVYVYKDLLALFAPLPYTDPSHPGPFNPQVHLTNTCLQTEPSSKIVRLLSSLPSTAPNLAQDWKSSAFTQIATATGELFLAAARTQSTHFQPLPNAFEVFGVDWLLDATGHAWLLEVNAFPDFAQSGDEGKAVVRGLWEGVLGLVVGEFFDGVGHRKAGVGHGMENWGMKEVLNIDLGRR